MGEAVESLDKERKERVTPIFISVDPARDGVKEVKRYIRGERETGGKQALGLKSRFPSKNDWPDGRL